MESRVDATTSRFAHPISAHCASLTGSVRTISEYSGISWRRRPGSWLR